MSTAIFSIFPFFLFFFPFTTISASSPSYLLSLSFPSFLFHGIRRRGSKLKRTIASKRVFVRHSNSSANIYIYIIYSIYTSFSLSLGGHSTKVRHCHATTLFESSRARTGEKAKKEELVRLSVCLVIIVGSESWWILVPRVLFVYPYTMRHGKYFDETIFFFFLYGDRYPPPARRYIYILAFGIDDTRWWKFILSSRIICRAPIESSRTIRDEQVNILRLH